MQITYLILAHKSPEQVNNLISALEYKNTNFIVHVDKRVRIKDFMLNICNKKVIFCQDRIKINWGGFSMIRATVKLIGAYFSENINSDYVFLISGEDYPIKSNEYIHCFLNNNNGYNFIQALKIPCNIANQGENGTERIQYYRFGDLFHKRGHGKIHVKLSSKLSDCIVELQKRTNLKRKFPEGYCPFFGSQWWGLTNDCLQEVFELCTSKNKLFSFFKYTSIPDELVFSTLVMNTNFRKKVFSGNLRFINWKGPRVEYFDDDDLSRIINSECLFARKFDFVSSESLINNIDIYRTGKGIKQKREEWLSAQKS